MLSRIFLTILLTVLFSVITVFGQLLPIKTYSIEEGLAQSQVQAILQDSVGYLWFGTRDGLSRFDGINFTTFTTHEGLASNSIGSVFLDGDSLIWFGHFTNGLTIYHQKHKRFRQLLLDSCMVNHPVVQIFRDRSGTFWFVVGYAGVLRWDGRKSVLINSDKGLPDNDIRALCQDSRGNMWAGTSKGIAIFPANEYEHPETYKYLTKDQGLPDDNVTALTTDLAGNIWIGTKHEGLFVYGKDDHIPSSVPLRNISKKEGLADNWIWSLYRDCKGYIWSGTMSGVSVIKQVTENSVPEIKNVLPESGFKHGTVSSIFQDREHNIWLGTFGGGVSKYRGSIFETYNHMFGLPDNMVWSITEDNLGRLWFATEKGISVHKKIRRTKKLELVKQITKKSGLPGNLVLTLFKDAAGSMWAGVYNGGLCKINPRTWHIQLYSGGEKPAFKAISDIERDRRGHIWISTFNHGVYEYNPKTGRFNHYTPDNGFPSLYVNSSFLDHKGRLWFATKDRGLIRKDRDKFEIFSKINKGRYCYINTLTQDSFGNFWVGTGGTGAFWVKGRQRKHFDMSNGLSGDYIFFIHCDNRGYVWFGTKKGVDRFNPVDSTFRHYDMSDGFYGGETNLNAVYESPQGELWFGCVNGAVKYCPKDDAINTIAPKLTIEDIQLFRQNAPLPPDGRFAYDENYLTFYFKAFSFTNPQKVRYKFCLKGFDKSWSPATSFTSATYSNLPPGEYEFQVKARNNDSVWTPKPAVYAFEIQTPFWKHWIFILFTIVLGVFLLYEIAKQRTKLIERQNFFLEEKVKERTAAITQEKEKAVSAFKASEESEENFRALAETSSSAIFIYQRSNFVYANKSTARITGYSVDELLTMKFWDVVHPDFQEIIRKYGLARQRGEKVPVRYEFMILRKDKTTRWIDFTAGRINFKGMPASLGTAFDITDRKIAEEALNQRESQLRLLINAMPDIVCFKDGQGRWIEANDFDLKLFGIENVDYRGKKDSELAPYSTFYREAFLTCEVTDEYAWQKRVISRGEEIIPRPDGTEKVFDIIKVPVFNEDGSRKALVVIGRDITEKKHAEEALRSEKEKLDIILKNLNEGVIATDEKGAIIFLNDSARRMLAAGEKQDLIGMVIFDLLNFYSQKGRKLSADPVRHSLKNGEVYQVNGPLIMQNLNDERLTVEFTCTPLQEHSGQLLGCVATFRDVTERQKLEEELFKARKLESLGVLAGGLAHDFNNILTAIIGNISLIKLRMGNNCPPKLHELLEKAEAASVRAQGLTQQLLTFSKGGAPVRKTTSIQDLVVQTTEFTLRGSNIKYEFFFPEELWPAEVDEGQISQVINNLVINSMQAMPNGGKLWINGKNIVINTKTNLPLEPGPYVELSFKDTGHGMSKEVMDSVFDPYFSTKKKGSGLGLASVFSILKKHNGYITVNSKINYGSTFTFYLTASPDKKVKEIKNGKIEGSFKGNILVMDDEADLRELVTDILTSVGFDVTACSDGQEAIVYYTHALQAAQPFNLVILDLTVPGGMGGKKTIEKLLEIDPKVKAIVSSGYSNDPIMAEYDKFGFKGVVTKPYSAEQLITVTNEMLNKKI